MAEGDKRIMCQTCGAIFIFTLKEQLAFKKKGFTNIPRRCPTCRKKKRSFVGTKRGNMGRALIQAVFTVKCSGCNRFFNSSRKPKPGLPAYCQACKVLYGGSKPNSRRMKRENPKG